MSSDGVQAIETGATLLSYLADAGEPVQLSAIARATGMASAKVHRYLRSYVRAGLVVQISSSRLYDLGPLAYSFGVAALTRHDVLTRASERLGELRDATGESTGLLIWTQRGPAVVRSEDSRRHNVALVIRVGGTVPLTTSAAGRVFHAFMPEGMTRKILGSEFASQRDRRNTPSTATFERQVAEARRRGYARIANDVMRGCSALAVPLFAQDGRLAAAVVVLGRSDVIDTGWEGRIGDELRRFVTRVGGIASKPLLR